MRIISGKFKGKKLALPNDKRTRPLKSIVKESIFNLIQHSNKFNVKVKNSYILDLFAGSGSFGLECISRDAKIVYFLENYSEALKVLKKISHILKVVTVLKLSKKIVLISLTQKKGQFLNLILFFLILPIKN